jgi:hypothetical protein
LRKKLTQKLRRVLGTVLKHISSIKLTFIICRHVDFIHLSLNLCYKLHFYLIANCIILILKNINLTQNIQIKYTRKNILLKFLTSSVNLTICYYVI